MYAHHLKLVLKHFAVMWVLTVMGLLLANFLPNYIVTPLALLTIILLVVFFFFQTIQLADYVLFVIPFFNGMFLFWVSQLFFNLLGKGFIFILLIGTALIMLILAILALQIPRNFPEWGTYAAASLIVIVIFFSAFKFFTIEHRVLFILAVIIVLLYALYTAYALNEIRHHHVRHHEIMTTAFSLYLSFVNIFFVLFDRTGRRR